MYKIMIDGGPEGYQRFNTPKENKMCNEEITAKWARKTAETQLNAVAEIQLKTCLTEIKKAVEKNKMSVNVYVSLLKPCLNELHKRGFEAQSYDDPRDGSWTTISW